MALRIGSLYLGEALEAGPGGSELFVAGAVDPGLPGEALDLNLQTSLDSEWLELALRTVWPESELRGGPSAPSGLSAGRSTGRE